MATTWTTVKSHTFGRQPMRAASIPAEPVVKSRFSQALAMFEMQEIQEKQSQSSNAASNGFGQSEVFGKKPMRHTHEFDSAASSAFGKRQENNVGSPAFSKTHNAGFDDVAASAFGNKRKESRAREWPASIVQKPVVVKKDVDLTSIELFPTLGAKPVSKSSSNTSLNTAANSLSFAEIMRKRREEEDIENAEKSVILAKEQEEEDRKNYIYNKTVCLRNRKVVSHGELEDDYIYCDENDLDYVHPSERKKAYPEPAFVEEEESFHEEEECNDGW